MVTTKTYTEPPICKKEILRYAGCKDTTDESLQFLLDECLEEVLPNLSYKVCYIELPIVINEDKEDYFDISSIFDFEKNSVIDQKAYDELSTLNDL